MLRIIVQTLLTPTSTVWLYVIAILAGVFVGATITGGWKQWLH